MGHLRREFPRRQDERLVDDNHLLHDAMIPQFHSRGVWPFGRLAVFF